MNKINFFLSSNFFERLNPFFSRKLFKIFKIFFIETKLNSLPENSYKIEEKLIDELESIYLDPNIEKIPYISYPDLINLLLVIKKENQDLNFCDYGGGNLNLYNYLNKKFFKLKYFFYDQQKIVNIVKEFKIKKNINNVFIDKEKIDDSLDIVYFGSSLQYIENYEQVISNFLNSKYILIAQTPFFSAPKDVNKVVLKQINMHPKINYLYMINLNNFIKFMNNNNFKLKNKSLNKVTKFMNFKNFDNRYKDLDMYDLLFERSIK